MKIRRRLKTTSEQSMASMSDIAFLLIIFFMVSSVFVIKDGLHLVLPDKNQKPVIKKASDVTTVTIKATGRITLNKKMVTEEDLETGLTGLLEKSDSTDTFYVLLNIHKSVPYHRTVKVVDAIKYSGVKKLTIKMI